MNDHVLATGIDVGSSAVKVAVIAVEGETIEVRSLESNRIRRRDPRDILEDVYAAATEAAGLSPDEIDYVATTGEGELVDFRRGHFYSMTAHARGAVFLDPEARAALDVGALHARAIRFSELGRVLDYRMTSQCASGSGQFLENIGRYLGVTLDEIGPLSLEASDAETVSSICAVLAETDVINMVSRGLGKGNILKGIHQSMGGRFVKLLGAARVKGVVLICGGLAADAGLAGAMGSEVERRGYDIEIRQHPNSVYSGALGAAIWGAYRHRVLERREAVAGQTPTSELSTGESP